MTEYTRVLPRDLFNESKLLKCLGFLTLAIHDCKIHGISFDFDGESFNIHLSDSGYLSVTNMSFYLDDGEYISFSTTYNCKSNYPLQFETESESDQVFTDDGNFTDEFLECLKYHSN